MSADAIDPNAILLTESGHPIGEIVVAGDDATTSAGMSKSESLPEAREEVLKETMVALTGDQDGDRALAEFFPGISDDLKRRKAMTMFVADRRSLKEIAAEVGVPERTVSMWVYNGRWDEIVRKDLAVRQSMSVLELSELRSDKRVELTREQLNQAKAIRDKAASDIKSNSVSLKSGTEAWAAAAKIEHTLVGMSEAGSVTNIDAENSADKKDGSGKTPLVMVFQGGLPPVRKA